MNLTLNAIGEVLSIDRQGARDTLLDWVRNEGTRLQGMSIDSDDESVVWGAETLYRLSNVRPPSSLPAGALDRLARQAANLAAKVSSTAQLKEQLRRVMDDEDMGSDDLVSQVLDAMLNLKEYKEYNFSSVDVLIQRLQGPPYLQPDHILEITNKLRMISMPAQDVDHYDFYENLSKKIVSESATSWSKTEDWVKAACLAFTREKEITPEGPTGVVYYLHYQAHSGNRT